MISARIFLALFFSIAATVIMSYISMAIPIGPWIESTLALSGILLMVLLNVSKKNTPSVVGMATAAGGIAGIMATACGFSFPTWYFLDPVHFNYFMMHPLYFALLMGSLTISASYFGYVIASLFEESFFKEPDMSFSIGQMTAKMLDVQQNMQKAVQLGAGFVGSLFISAMHTMRHMSSSITLFSSKTLGIIKTPPLFVRLDLAPMLFAIGFVTGHVLMVPLLVGVLTKYFMIDPMHKLFFPALSSENVVLAFCTGLVVQGALLSIIDLPTVVIAAAKRLAQKSPAKGELWDRFKVIFNGIELVIGALVTLTFLTWCGFSVIEQAYVLVFSFVCTYQLMIIGGKIGLAPLGRFATFLLLPFLLIFGYDPLKATIIATFVEISGGVAVDVLFGRKMAQVAEINKAKLARYQLLGIAVASLSIGIVFWLLISHFGVGSTELFAQKAQARALLIKAFYVDYRILIVGLLYAFLLRFMGINAVLVLGGLSMPVDFSIMLVAGGFCASVIKNHEDYFPFWSGVFAASSLWMLVRALL